MLTTSYRCFGERKGPDMATMTKTNGNPVVLAPVSEGGNEIISLAHPYRAIVRLQGSTDILLHGWNAEAVDEKANAAKNSRAKSRTTLKVTHTERRPVT